MHKRPKNQIMHKNHTKNIYIQSIGTGLWM
jgi:hypothetical protein